MLKTCGQLLASLLLWHGLWTILDDLQVLLQIDNWIGYRGMICTAMGILVLIVLHYCCAAEVVGETTTEKQLDELSNSSCSSSSSVDPQVKSSEKDCTNRATTSIKEMLDEIV